MGNRSYAAFEEWRGDYLGGSPRSSDDDDLAEAFTAGWKAAFESLGLTPRRLRELEAQYKQALEPKGK